MVSILKLQNIFSELDFDNEKKSPLTIDEIMPKPFPVPVPSSLTILIHCFQKIKFILFFLSDSDFPKTFFGIQFWNVMITHHFYVIEIKIFSSKKRFLGTTSTSSLPRASRRKREIEIWLVIGIYNRK